MDARRIDDLHPVPIVAFCFLRCDGGTDIRLYARKHLDDARFSRAVLAYKDKLDRPLIGLHILGKSLGGDAHFGECFFCLCQQIFCAFGILIQGKIFHLIDNSFLKTRVCEKLLGETVCSCFFHLRKGQRMGIRAPLGP